jgi:hypothetical protein
VPVLRFLQFLCFRKVTQEIFSELDETKPEPPISPDTRRSPKESLRGARDQPEGVVWAPWSTSDIAPSPIRSLRRENPKSFDVSPSKVL